MEVNKMESVTCREIVTKEVLYSRLERDIRCEEDTIRSAEARLSMLRYTEQNLNEYFADEELRNKQKNGINLTNKDKETLNALIDIRNTCRNVDECIECKYNVNGGHNCYFMDGMPCDWTDLEKVFEKKDDGKED